MTIAAAYLTSEGVVFGADSATTISRPQERQTRVVQLLNHAQKIFEVGNPGRIAVCTWGLGIIGTTSHRTIVARLADMLDKEAATVEEAALKLRDIVGRLVSETPGGLQGPIGYFVGGHDPVTHDPACHQIVFSPGGSSSLEELPLGQARFSGAPQVFDRVFRGFDPQLPRLLFNALTHGRSDLPSDFKEHFEKAFNDVAHGLVAAGTEDIPIRDAIDYIHTYVRMTVKAFKFRFGPPLCGGPLEIGFVTTDRPFRWVRHKGFETAMTEQEPER